MTRIICVCGARPNFMKIAAIVRALRSHGGFETLLVHTGQHYDENMSRTFFGELGLPQPDINMEVGSASHSVQTARIMERFEPVALDFQPDYVLVVGDVNSTIACGLVAAKLGFKLIHVEAGLRSFDRTMPEEINRVLTDSISDLLFVTEQSGIDNLKKEGVDPAKIHFVGNVMIDTLLANKSAAGKSDVLQRLGVSAGQYGVVTLHRPSNVDDMMMLGEIVSAFEEIEKEIKLVFPMHPRTRNRIGESELAGRIEAMKNLLLVEPLGYLDFLCLMSNAMLVLTDSGGIQEETTVLGVPCMTLRKNTERPVTISDGTNRLVEMTSDGIVKAYRRIRQTGPNTKAKTPKFWDGRAAERIVKIISETRDG
ncbi:MAG: UDP-N-acetylglucosamine 2-epimerase (non-hydrolyzing) [Sedimentisphaerales bacterium]|nr:UDP-N-acetylglucosamine 2-epimerase (non-hydrolyzing) [Sedimentisphaerales bacterium]